MTTESDPGNHTLSAEPRRALSTDGLLILIAGGALVAFYLLFKAVSILAGLPFP